MGPKRKRTPAGEKSDALLLYSSQANWLSRRTTKAMTITANPWTQAAASVFALILYWNYSGTGLAMR